MLDSILKQASAIRQKESIVFIKNAQNKAVKSIGYQKEDVMLSDFMIFAKNSFPVLRNTIFHIENEGSTAGQSGKIKGSISLSKGKLAGVPDVCCVCGNKIRFAELKLPKQTLSDAQEKLHPIWHAHGVEIHMIYNFNDWLKFLSLYVKIDSELW